MTDRCTDSAKFDGAEVACTRETGHPGMHMAEDRWWSPGMGIRRPEPQPSTIPLSEAIRGAVAPYSTSERRATTPRFR